MAFLDILRGAGKIFGEKKLPVELEGWITLHSELWYLAPGISEMKESAREQNQVPIVQFLLSERLHQIYSSCGAPQLSSTRKGLVERCESSLLEKPSCLPLPLMRCFEEHHS